MQSPDSMTDTNILQESMNPIKHHRKVMCLAEIELLESRCSLSYPCCICTGMLIVFGVAADSEGHDCRNRNRKHADTSTDGKSLSQGQFVVSLWLGEIGCPVVYIEALSHTSDVRFGTFTSFLTCLYTIQRPHRPTRHRAVGDTVYISD